MMRILSFDVGICNLAFVVCEIHPETGDCVVEAVELANLTCLSHDRVSKELCSIHHTNELGDRFNHFVQEYEHMWGSPDLVLIERQPIRGITAIESFLFQLFRSVAVKISPGQVHRWMHINHLDYDGRKESAVFHADPWLSIFSSYQKHERRHDMADALMLVFFHLAQLGPMEESCRFLRVRHWSDFARPANQNKIIVSSALLLR